MANSPKEAKKVISVKVNKTAEKGFSHEYTEIKFESQVIDRFRAVISSAPEGLGVVIWLENKRTKQQWQATVKNISECGPAGVPEGAVIAFLKVNNYLPIHSCKIDYFLMTI